MNIKDPGLRRAFELAMRDGQLSKSDAEALVASVQDYDVVTTTETQDLHAILSSLGDRLSPGAREELATFLGVPMALQGGPAPTGGVSALNLTIQALRQQPLDDLDRSESAAIFSAAKEGGVTAMEASKLQEVYTRYAGSWSTSVREFWRNGLSSLRSPDQGIIRTATGAAEPEDLSSRLDTIWMQGFDDDVQQSLVTDMLFLAFQKGFKMTLLIENYVDVADVAEDLCDRTGMSLQQLDDVLDIHASQGEPTVWGEDNKILTDGDDVRLGAKVLVPPQIDDSILTRAQLFSAGEGYHPMIPDSYQGAVAQDNGGYYAAETANAVGREWETTSCYMEGGNVVPGTTTDGEPYALVGRDSLLISAFHLDESGAFSRSEVRDQVRKMEAAGGFSAAEIDDVARRLEATDLAYDNGWIEPYINNPDLLPGRITATSAMKARAKEFLATVELTKERMSDDLGIDAQRLVFVEQPEFHIDMAMRPLGPGEVMVHHPRQSLAVLDEALASGGLSWSERRELQSMREHAEHELATLGPVFDKIIDQLEDAGLMVAQAPGVFQSDTRQANFMNAVPGYTEDGSANYIVLGSGIKPLERAFESFVKKFGVDEVHFVGNEEIESGLTAGEISLSLAGGIDCRESSHAGTDSERHDLLHAYLNGR